MAIGSECQTLGWLDLPAPGLNGDELRTGYELRRVRVASQEKTDAEQVVMHMVAAALAARHSWAEIGRAAGISRQAAHARWRSVKNERAPDTSLERLQTAVAEDAPPTSQRDAVKAARAARHSWAEIAAAAGVSLKTAHKRWGGIPKGRTGQGLPHTADGALANLRTAIAVVEIAAHTEQTTVRAARAAGSTWDDIGRATRLSRQAASLRWN